MVRKIFAFLLCVCTLCLSGCSKEPVDSTSSAPVSSVVSVPEPTYYLNPLTGEKDLKSKSVSKRRPVAIMVNNISVAQSVQTGLTGADIVYETEVEGGITRLLAVYQDISSVKKIGTVRSARYAYVDLAMGHNAIYVHHGQDNTYCAPHLRDTDHFVLGTSNGGQRIKNGLASEHTLYANGKDLWKYIKDSRDTKNSSSSTWQKFADEEEKLSFEKKAKTISVPFSSSYKTVFKYSKKSGKYVRYFKDTLREDYYSGKSETFKNVFVLMTSISNYPDGYHKKIDLTSGEGYYCVNGTYIPIKWSKGNASSGFVFTKKDGSPLEVNAGNSWVCIANKSRSTPTFS